MKNVSLILDVAHGCDVDGKQSPCGRHKEWLWSRNMVREMMHTFNNILMPFAYHAPFLDYKEEPGFEARLVAYNEICKADDYTLMLSLHNDAAHKSQCDTNGWCKSAKGIAFWTSRGETDADNVASDLYNHFKIMMPREHYRTAYWLNKGESEKDPDWEANFNILAGYKGIKPNYEGVLMEVGFQTNKADVKKLLNKEWNNSFRWTLINALCNILIKKQRS